MTLGASSGGLYRWLGVLAAAGLVGYAGQAWWRGPVVDLESVTRRDLVQTVVGSGRVESPNRVDIASQITATVARVPVQEGMVVRAGEVLIALSDADLQAAARQGELAVVQARARMRQLRDVQSPLAAQALRQADAQLESARAGLRRSQALVQQGFMGQAALDDAAKAVELADAQVAVARLQLDSTRAAGSDFALAAGAVVESQAAADVARSRAAFALIRAPRDGLLISRHVEVGDVVQPGKVLMTLSPSGAVQLVLDVDEKNLRLIALGQTALVSADAYMQERFTARVAYVNPGVNAQTGAVEIKLDVDPVPAYLRQDMTVSIDIEVARRPQALVLSAAAIHGLDSVAPWCWVYAKGQARRTALTVGSRSAGQVEVLSGLAEGDRVILGAGAVYDAQRVRARRTAL